ncbi:hypothetical protein SAMN04488137_3440 [Fictibacillus solisalsi]|uniref:Uncharacterized protein n=1 Tax=Fictibacillus solisalsi TaxID=459525 RepID=A0A1G9YJE5_9BACL|nr:hypothetical protein [Fictibacillus solisalsi]SDN08595.1 hypothetical protein SAMN04488137_3440 [Fictibacillus solisalsi]
MGNTTNMLIEHLINGFHFFIALVLCAIMVLGVDFFQPLFGYLKSTNKDTLLALFVLMLPFVYTLGILIDNFVDDVVFKKRKKETRDENRKTARELILLTNDQNQANQLDYIRTKIRITRTACFNFALITLFSLVIMYRTYHFKYIAVMILIGLLGGLLTFLAYWSWEHNTKSSNKRVRDGFRIYEKHKTAKKEETTTPM